MNWSTFAVTKFLELSVSAVKQGQPAKLREAIPASGEGHSADKLHWTGWLHRPFCPGSSSKGQERTIFVVQNNCVSLVPFAGECCIYLFSCVNHLEWALWVHIARSTSKVSMVTPTHRGITIICTIHFVCGADNYSFPLHRPETRHYLVGWQHR